ncbi:MAG: N-acetyltransferase [Salinivirgaceae bacterium]
MNFLASKCTFTFLSPEIIANSKQFDCGHPDLNDFFSTDCIHYNNKLLGKSYSFILTEDPTTIVCALTVSNDSIKTNLLPNSRKKKLLKSIPRSKHASSYPAVLIGRLGVNINFKGQGIGHELMDFIKAWFIDPNNKTGCRYIVVDAYNVPESLHYYERNDFQFIFSTPAQEKKHYNLSSKATLNTRLMVFDLIDLTANPQG